MIETLKTNAAARAAYLRMNGIKHAEIWDTDSGYRVALCTSEGFGWPESQEFATIGQCAAWAKSYIPELSLIS